MRICKKGIIFTLLLKLRVMKIELQNTEETFLITEEQTSETFEAILFIDGRLAFAEWSIDYTIEDYSGSWDVAPTSDLVISDLTLTDVVDTEGDVFELTTEQDKELEGFLKQLKYEL